MKHVVATLDDLPEILELEACFPTKERWSEASWEQELRGSRRTTLVARDARLLGVITFQDMGEAADLNRIVVRPDARRQGVADALMQAGLSTVGKRCLLEVRDDNLPAVELYRKHGFSTIHRRNDYYGAGADALVMERNCKP